MRREGHPLYLCFESRDVMHSTEHERRKHQRFEVSADSQEKLTAELRTDDQSPAITGTVSDISLSGTKLVADKPLPAQTTVDVTLSAGDVSLALQGVVRWMTPKDEGEWYIGCRFDELLDPEFVGELASLGIVERRRYARTDARLRAMVRRELDSQQTHPVEIVDYSEGGFCIRSEQKFPRGDRLMVEVPLGDDESRQILARSQWYAACHTGCAFLKANGVTTLREAAHHQTPIRPRTFRRRFATALGITVILAWSALVHTGHWGDIPQHARGAWTLVSQQDWAETGRRVQDWVTRHLPNRD